MQQPDDPGVFETVDDATDAILVKIAKSRWSILYIVALLLTGWFANSLFYVAQHWFFDNIWWF